MDRVKVLKIRKLVRETTNLLRKLAGRKPLKLTRGNGGPFSDEVIHRIHDTSKKLRTVFLQSTSRIQQFITTKIKKIEDTEKVVKGGPGSGNFDHEGRPGEQGGSGPGGDSGSVADSGDNGKSGEVSPEQKKLEGRAIKDYTSSKYLEINKQLRADVITSAHTETIHNIDNLLDRSPKFSGTVYRGMKGVPDKFVNSLESGDIFVDKSFVSTSQNQVTPTQVSGGRELIFIISARGKNGVDISNMSRYRDEAEVLFRRNTQFKITKITASLVDADTKKVFMEEI